MKITKNRDERRFLRKQKTARFFRKFFISFFVLILVFVVFGIFYTWYIGKNVDDSSFDEPMDPVVYKQVEHIKPAENVPVSVSIQSITTPVLPGSNVSLIVRTKSEATCSIIFTYDDIKSTDSGLVDKKADEFGTVSWSWTVDESTPLGTWPAKVTCFEGEKSGVFIGDVEVVSEL